METVLEKIGDIRILHLRGRLDVRAAAEFESLVKGLIAAGERTFVLDCQDLNHVSSAGLGAFISCGKLLEDRGAFVFAGCTSHIKALFEITGLSGRFRTCNTTQDALQALGCANAP